MHIEIDGITKKYPGVTALSNASFSVQRGAFHAVCGENGAGKSTLMKLLSGVETEYEGTLRIAGKEVRFFGTKDAEAAGVSIIHQELNLVEELSAAANIFLGRELRSSAGWIDNRAMREQARSLLRELECTIDPDALAGTLRVGDQQIVEIAKALSLKADILIMDEPTSALTESEVERLVRVIGRLRQKGVTILYISHKMEEIFRLSDTITVLRDGTHVRTLPRSATNAKEITHLMVGREIEQFDVHSSGIKGEVVLQVCNLSLPWPGHARRWRLQGVNLELRAGEILGIAGLMGAGRTELLECLFGASSARPTGEIRLLGQPVSFTHPYEAIRAGIAMVSEDRKRLGIFTELSVGKNISLCALEQSTKLGWLRTGHEKGRIAETMEKLRVKAAGPESAITSLSGGNQQKAIIGRWLQTNPRVLLLDDPTRGVDVGAKAELYRLMRQLCSDGLAIIVTSSELPELLTVSDRITVLAEGRQTAEFSREEATEQRIMEAATQFATAEKESVPA